MSEFNPSARTKDNPLGRVPHERDRIGEIQDRLRRIETRLTKYMQERGFETQAQVPIYGGSNDRISIPSLDVRLKDVLAAIPDGEDSPEPDPGRRQVEMARKALSLIAR